MLPFYAPMHFAHSESGPRHSLLTTPSAGFAVCLALGFSFGIAACGSYRPTDQALIVETIGRFREGVEKHRYRQICDQALARKIVDKIESVGLSCPFALKPVLEKVREPAIVVGQITVHGNRAQAAVRSCARDQSPSRDEMDLERERQGWRIASLSRRSP